ncbi:all-trans-phytoene synthase [Nitrospirota bacterium]|jgi:phytoene synthase|nr:presqualene diphosphate synthase HpnD [Nitrospiraceae bacterium]GBL40596.1 all-trans-phytoene synthase [Nitrospirota bacterium]GDX89640.1 phytoene synthase [Nitrospirota bacterium]
MTLLSPAKAQAYCTNLTKKSGSNFYYSFLFLPRKRRAAMYTIYAFCKEVDNAVDDPPADSNPSKELQRWWDELQAAYEGTPTFPVTISLAHHVRELSIPRAYFEELIKGVGMDLSAVRYASMQDLSLYCYRVASVVGLICLHVFGPTSARAQDYAVSLGMAFQLTNILRDIGTDAAQGRIYLPQEDLQQFGCTETILLQQQENEALHTVLRFEVVKAHEYYAKAQAAFESLPAHERQALAVSEIMRAVYSRILKKIEKPEHRVFGPRVRLSTPHRLALAAGVWLRSRFA